MSNPLKIYKASAGSGKTFTLAVEYIKLLVQNPDEYKHILAVTFTNKATGEMKNRILGQLYGLANRLEDSDDYLEKIKEDENIKALDYSDDMIRENCGKALHRIIHDYSRFRIETIDSFFQSVIRDLSRELDLTSNLRIDLNSGEVLQEAVDTIIEELTPNQNIFKAILSFVRERISDGRNWLINDDVSEFGRNIFREDYLKNRKVISAQTQNIKDVLNYKSSLYKLRNDIKAQLKQDGNDLRQQKDSLGLTKDEVKNNHLVEGFINKLLQGEFPNISATAQGWHDDATTLVKDQKQTRVIVDNFAPTLKKAIEDVQSLQTLENSISAIIKNLNQLMLLNVINEKVRSLNSEANRFLLADSAHFLNDMIDGSDIPFIYEKAGTKFHHIMIDEFQDTSALQWENFKPLISNSMSAGQSCLIVGDVKQSIYRWRDSDWQILNKGIETDFNKYIESIALDTNYRSAGNIIHFNNQFFVQAKKLVNKDYKNVHKTDSIDLLTAYSDVCQKVKPKNEGRGFVHVSNYVGPDYKDEDHMPRRILDTVKGLHEDGVEWNDMTILVRTNNVIPKLCQYFNDHSADIDTKIVSAEAFRLDSSAAVNLIILALTAIRNPKDAFAIRNLALHYQLAKNGQVEEKEDTDRFFLSTDEELEQLLPQGFMANIERYSFTPLYEIIEELYAVLELENIANQDAYLFYFHDQVNNYVKDKQNDIDSFLSYWEEKMSGVTIPNASSDGIQIMSIHKSKGLEFHTVIVPYCDWDITGLPKGGKKGSILWCNTLDPFNGMDIVPVNFEKQIDNTIFQSAYREEVLRNNVDNLNILYVAFTRASENLIILTGENKDEEKEAKNGKKKTMKTEDEPLSNIQQVIVDTVKKIGPETVIDLPDGETPIALKEEGNEGYTIWTYGEPVASEPKTEKTTENVLEQKYKDINTSFVHQKANVSFRQSNESTRYIINDDTDDTYSNEYIKKGLVYHHIFELIKTREDVDRVIDELDGRGYFDSMLGVDEARSAIKKALDNPTASKWFDSGWTDFNECSIMYRNDERIVEERRPDRVIVKDNETIVIDYKSGWESPKHSEQVSEYMTLLDRMGYTNIKGYVWYFMQDKITDVPLKEGGRK